MHPTVQRFYDQAQASGFTLDILQYEQTTRTAQEAADAIGCAVGQIVKSLCFSVNDTPVMALLSGDNRLDTKKLAKLMSVGRKKVKRANPEFVRAATGFAIGGVPPFGHTQQMTCFIDEHLLRFDEIWAAAGTPNAVFRTTVSQLQQATNGTVADLKVV